MRVVHVSYMACRARRRKAVAAGAEEIESTGVFGPRPASARMPRRPAAPRRHRRPGPRDGWVWSRIMSSIRPGRVARGVQKALIRASKAVVNEAESARNDDFVSRWRARTAERPRIVPTSPWRRSTPLRRGRGAVLALPPSRPRVRLARAEAAVKDLRPAPPARLRRVLGGRPGPGGFAAMGSRAGCG